MSSRVARTRRDVLSCPKKGAAVVCLSAASADEAVTEVTSMADKATSTMTCPQTGGVFITKLAASGGDASWAGGGGGGSAATVVAEGEGNNANAIIGEEHNDRARNITTLRMRKTRDLIVCLSRDICSSRETSSFPLS